jgi:hypothetical protein
MSEKKTKTDAAAKKSAKKKSSKKSAKETNPAKVRKEVSKIVKARAVEMAEAVIGKTEEGGVPDDLQLATVKYMFEVAAIYPPQSDQDAATDEEDSLAKTLLRRLNIPEEPVRREEDEDGAPVEKASEGESEGSVVKENEEIEPAQPS